MNQPSKLTRARALEIASLDRAAGRRKHGQFRIEGWRAVESAMNADAPLLGVVVRSDVLGDSRLKEFAVGAGGYEVRSLSTKAVARLTSVMHDQGILAISEIPITDRRSLTAARRIVALDAIQDPGNVGTLVRCAAWFGFDAVIAGSGTADFYNPKVVRSTAGAMWDIDLLTTENLPVELDRLGAAGFEIAAADLTGQHVTEWKPGEKTVLVLGSEAHGLADEIRETVGAVATFLRIDPAPRETARGNAHRNAGVESLNVAVAGGIIMHRMRM
ncbi:MAG: TrmH family RNA methyltransferase [Rhodothermia bacterium]